MKQNYIDIEKEIQSGGFLFKYCRFDNHAIQIIINDTLYFSAPDKLNDPLDSRFNLEIKNRKNFSMKTRNLIKKARFTLNEEIDYLLRDLGMDVGKVESQDRFFKEYFTYLQNTYYGVNCFSLNHADNLLWTHYANEAKGLCFVFDKELLIKSLKDCLNKKTHYQIIHGNITYRGVKKLEINLYKNGNFSYSLKHLFSKTLHWAYEKEYRLLLNQRTQRISDFIALRYDPFLEFNKDCLKYIIIGERMSFEHRQILSNLKDKGVIKAEILFHKFN